MQASFERGFRASNILSSSGPSSIIPKPSHRWPPLQVCQRCIHHLPRILQVESGLRQGRKQLGSAAQHVEARRIINSWQCLISKRGLSTSQRRHELPSQEESRRSHTSKRLTHAVDNLQANIFIAGQRLNDLTGYSAIEALKKDIEEQETLVEETRRSLVSAREAYSSAIAQRSTSQRESNELLQRKHTWTPNDLERFTALYRSDHANEMAESAARDKLAEAEKKAEDAANLLSKGILARYHEEQIWSDKIRRMSTWGTWGLMGVNILLFLIFQIGVEPWKRKRLVKGFEDKVVKALEREDSPSRQSLIETPILDTEVAATTTAVGDGPVGEGHNLAHQEEPLTTTKPAEPGLMETSPIYALQGQVSAPRKVATLKGKFYDLFSERDVMLKQVELTTVVLEGAAVGAAVVGLLVLALRPY